MITKGAPFGGAQKYVYTLATALPTDSFEATVLVGEGNDLKDRLQHRGVPVITLGDMRRDINVLSEFRAFSQLLKIIRTIKPDILHLNSTKAGGLGALAGRLCGVPHIIYTVHGWPFNEKRGPLVTFVIWLLSAVSALLCHTVIVIARSEERSALSLPFVNKDRIQLVFNGIAPIEFEERNTARQRLLPVGHPPIPDNVLWLGSIAELHRNKNISAALEALSRIEIPFLYVVIGEGEQRPALEEQIRTSKLGGKVILAGKLDNAAAYLKAFDIFILPSLKEGTPYALLEAGLAGLPCLSTAVGGIPELIADRTSGILVQPVADEIRTGLEFLMSHPFERQRFGAEFRNTIVGKFSMQQMLTSTLNIYSRSAFPKA